MGDSGELVIGGVGLARYLDPEKDAEKYAPLRVPGLGAGLPQRRPRPRRAGGAGLPRARPTSRSSSAAGGSSSARWTPRCRRCPGSPARPPPCARPAAATSCSSATSSPSERLGPRGGRRAAARRTARRARAAARAGRRTADPHLRQGGPRRAALAAARRWRAARPRRAALRHRGLARRAVDARCSASPSPAPRRLLRDRRQQPGRGPARPRGCATRYPSAAVARHLPAAHAAQAGPAAGEVRAGRRRGADRRAGRRAGRRSSSCLLLLPLFTLVGLRWTVGAAGARQRARRFGGYPGRRPPPGGCVAAGAALLSQPAGPARPRRRRRPAAAARRAARAATRAAAACTCGCGRPSGWPSSAARPR